MSKQKFLVGAIAGLCLAGWGLGSAGAQTTDSSLKGVKNFELVIEELDDDSATCGVTEPGIIKATKKGVKRAPFKLGGKEYALYVQVTTLPQDDKCFSAIYVQAYYYGEMPLPNFPEGNFAEVSLWDQSTITITSRRAHGSNVSKLITQLSQKLAADWKKDNS